MSVPEIICASAGILFLALIWYALCRIEDHLRIIAGNPPPHPADYSNILLYIAEALEKQNEREQQ